MIYVTLLITNILLLIINTSFLPQFWNVSASFLVVLSLSFSLLLFKDLKDLALVNALIGGVVYDLWSYSIFGMYTFAFVLTVGAVSFLKNYLSKGSLFVVACAMCVFLIGNFVFRKDLTGAVSGALFHASLLTLFYFLIQGFYSRKGTGISRSWQ